MYVMLLEIKWLIVGKTHIKENLNGISIVSPWEMRAHDQQALWAVGVADGHVERLVRGSHH